MNTKVLLMSALIVVLAWLARAAARTKTVATKTAAAKRI